MKGKAGDDGQGRGGLDPTDAALLRAALSPRSLDDLVTATSVPRSTVHRRAGHLIEAGLLSWSAQHYQTTPAGQKLLEGAPVSRLPPCHMDAHLRFLNLLPTPVHRAVLLMVFFLGVARRDDVVEDMHAVVALVGATQRLKSWLTKLCCFLFGADPKDCEISMMQTRGRGLLTRLGPRGEVTYECETVRQPIVWLNEVSRMDPRVKRDLVAIMHGRKTINIENRELTIEGVPILEFNLRRRTGSLEERLGLEPPLIRRAFIADFTAVSVSSEMRAQSPELATRIKACGPVALPKAPKTSLPPQYHRLVDQACAECVADEFRDFTDPGRIITLIWGAQAWLPDREATEEALYNCFLLYETSGFLKADWRSRLALVLAHPAASAEGAAATPPAAGPVPPAAGPVPPVPEPGPAALPWLQDDPAEGSEFDADAGILCLKHLLEKAGLQSPRDDQAIADLLAALAPLHKKKLTPDDVTAVLARLPFLDSLRQWMDNARLAEKDVAAATDLLAALRRNQWGAEELYEALGYKNWLDQLGLSPAEANGLLQQLVAASADQGDVIGFVVAAAREGLTAQSRREELTASVAQMEAEVQSLQEVLRQQRDELARLQQACGQAKTQLAALHEEHGCGAAGSGAAEATVQGAGRALGARQGRLGRSAGPAQNSAASQLPDARTKRVGHRSGRALRWAACRDAARLSSCPQVWQPAHAGASPAEPGSPRRGIVGSDAPARGRGRSAEEAAARPAPAVLGGCGRA